jgi:hypothetical protein
VNFFDVAADYGIAGSDEVDAPISFVAARGPFGAHALAYQAAGICVLPVGSDKKPLVNWKHLKGRSAAFFPIQSWVEKFGHADIAMLAGRQSRITVVDVDARHLVDLAIERFGETPLKVETRRGVHLWYAHSGEKRLTGVGGHKIDVLGNGIVVVPPSRHKDGGEYRWLAGDLGDIDRLPPIKDGSLPWRSDRLSPGGGRVAEGDRNRVLFGRGRAHAWDSETFEELINKLEIENAAWCDPPLDDDEVHRVARSLWGYVEDGTLLPPSERYVRLTVEEGDRYSPDAVKLLVKLRSAHQGLRDEFAVANAMAKTLGWTLPRFRRTRLELEIGGAIHCKHRGGRGKNDPPVYEFNGPSCLVSG